MNTQYDREGDQRPSFTPEIPAPPEAATGDLAGLVEHLGKLAEGCTLWDTDIRVITAGIHVLREHAKVCAERDESRRDSDRIHTLAYNPDYIDLEEFDEEPDKLRAAIDRILVSGTYKPNLRAQLTAARADARALGEAVRLAFIENQNLHCSTTISPKIGWEALERQTVILKHAYSAHQRSVEPSRAEGEAS